MRDLNPHAFYRHWLATSFLTVRNNLPQILVGMEGVEPPRFSAMASKTIVSTGFHHTPMLVRLRKALPIYRQGSTHGHDSVNSALTFISVMSRIDQILYLNRTQYSSSQEAIASSIRRNLSSALSIRVIMIARCFSSSPQLPSRVAYAKHRVTFKN